MDLRAFDKFDWMTWAGCESKNPLVGYASRRDTPDGGEMSLIVDGCHVEAHIYAAGCQHTARTYTFPDAGTAMLFALNVRGSEPAHILDLKASKFCCKRISAEG